MGMAKPSPLGSRLPLREVGHFSERFPTAKPVAICLLLVGQDDGRTEQG